MYDLSALPFQENVKQTKQAVDALKSINPTILVEGEIGNIGTGSEIRGFSIEIGQLADDTELRVDRWLAAGELWLWDDGEAVSMAVSRKPAEGVVRISGVYTPANKRNRGYAAACVHALSKHMRDAGFRCVLYTDLANPTSNSIYRRVGYRAVAEGLRYRFE